MSATSRISSFAIAAALLVASASASAIDDANAQFNSVSDSTPSSGAIAADILILRPLSFVGTVLGTAVFIVGLPAEAIAGDISGPAHRLVEQPAAFTFTRALGDTGGRTD